METRKTKDPTDMVEKGLVPFETDEPTVPDPDPNQGDSESSKEE
jgi:hypothetical protein